MEILIKKNSTCNILYSWTIVMSIILQLEIGNEYQKKESDGLSSPNKEGI